MRLICGLVRLDGKSADRTTVDAMIAALTPPGMTPAVAMVLRDRAALAVLECGASSAARLGTDCLLLAADFRLDRARELAAELGLPESIPEPELVAAAVVRWGP